MIIGITGKAGCGKSTLANYICDAYFQITKNTSPSVMSFADPIRDVAAAVFGSRYESQESKAAIDPFWQARIRKVRLAHYPYSDEVLYSTLGDRDVSGRRILQFVGTEMFRRHVHFNIWLYAMERRLPTDPSVHVIIPDVRFDNEADWIRARGGIVYHLWREGQEETPAAHASEERLRMKGSDVHACTASLQGLRNIAGDIVRQHLK